MPIEFNQKSGIINIHNQKISYIIQILNNELPVHRYFGHYLSEYSADHRLPSGNHAFSADISKEFPYSVTSIPLEYSTIGSGDYRIPSYLVKNEYNQLIPILKYAGYTITDKPINCDSLPTTVSKEEPVSTLTLHLMDPQTKLKIDLNYTIFENSDLILRSTTFKNSGTSVLSLEAATSAQLDLSSDKYKVLTLNGTHAHEANPSLEPLNSGIQMFHTFRGTSGPQQQPFAALVNPNTTEFSGEAIGLALVWSGNFETAIEVDQYKKTRLHIGLEPTTFNWQLKPNTSFQTPEAVMTWSDKGLNGMSQSFHQFGKQLIPKSTNDTDSVINTWESMKFDVSETKVSQFIKDAHLLGLKTIVVDDGWFINRNSEHGQLGCWVPDQNKFPNGLTPLVNQAHNLGMQFGLWIEPEMVTENSPLYKEHPEWVLNYRGRTQITARHQLVLDLSQDVVRKHLVQTMTNLVKENKLDYLKWDMNRHLTQVGNSWLPNIQQDELYYRYVIGLYEIMRDLKQNCPNLIIENCSAGGGRLDFGMLSYTNQTWISDLTDPIDRSKIENGFSYLFPQSIFSNHASVSPNQQNGRITSLKVRLQSASIGQMGLELDINDLSESEKETVKQQFKQYQSYWPADFKDANFYRLNDILFSDKITWLLVTPDKKHALLFYSNELASAVKVSQELPLHYLDDQMQYELSTGEHFLGQELNTVGITIQPPVKDFETNIIFIKQI